MMMMMMMTMMMKRQQVSFPYSLDHYCHFIDMYGVTHIQTDGDKKLNVCDPIHINEVAVVIEAIREANLLSFHHHRHHRNHHHHHHAYSFSSSTFLVTAGI